MDAKYLSNRLLEILKLTPLRLAGVPPPMAHCEITVDSNIVDVSFSHSGTRIAVLTRDNFSVFAWPLKKKPVPAPLLESSYPLPEAAQSRPRRISFLGDNEVYILNHFDPYQRRIERTALDTRETEVVYAVAEEKQLHSIFSSLGHEKLWFSKSFSTGAPISYSNIVPHSGDVFQSGVWNDSPGVDTFWAEAIQISDDQVWLRIPEVSTEVLTEVGRLGHNVEDWRSLCK
jgi:elongator complex protein 1